MFWKCFRKISLHIVAIKLTGGTQGHGPLHTRQKDRYIYIKIFSIPQRHSKGYIVAFLPHEHSWERNCDKWSPKSVSEWIVILIFKCVSFELFFFKLKLIDKYNTIYNINKQRMSFLYLNRLTWIRINIRWSGLLNFILNNWWMRLSILWRIIEIEKGVIRQVCRPRRITPSGISIILHLIWKLNSISV